jgi:hypothetical protein
VTVGREDLEVLAQIFFDRLRLGRRFHDDQVFAHDHDDGGWDGMRRQGQRPGRALPPAKIRQRGDNSGKSDKSSLTFA